MRGGAAPFPAAVPSGSGEPQRRLERGRLGEPQAAQQRRRGAQAARGRLREHRGEPPFPNQRRAKSARERTRAEQAAPLQQEPRAPSALLDWQSCSAVGRAVARQFVRLPSSRRHPATSAFPASLLLGGRRCTSRSPTTRRQSGWPGARWGASEWMFSCWWSRAVLLQPSTASCRHYAQQGISVWARWCA